MAGAVERQFKDIQSGRTHTSGSCPTNSERCGRCIGSKTLQVWSAIAKVRQSLTLTLTLYHSGPSLWRADTDATMHLYVQPVSPIFALPLLMSTPFHSDQIRRCNTCVGGACFRGHPRHCICTNASRVLSVAAVSCCCVLAVFFPLLTASR